MTSDMAGHRLDDARVARPRHAPRRLVSVLSNSWRQKGLILAVTWIALVVLAAIFADLLPLEDPETIPLSGETHVRPLSTWENPLGTDGFARDYLSRIIYGARVSLVVGVGGVLLALVVGGAIGLMTALARPRLRITLEVVTDSVLAFPPLVLLVGLVAVLRPSVTSVLVGFTILSTPVFARLVRGVAGSILSREFVVAARVLGATNWRVALKEVVPNVLGPAGSYGLVLVGVLITAEASLSFLGLSVAPPYPTWGSMIAEAQTTFDEHPQGLVVPAGAIFLTVLAFNRLGDAAKGRWEIGSKLI